MNVRWVIAITAVALMMGVGVGAVVFSEFSSSSTKLAVLAAVAVGSMASALVLIIVSLVGVSHSGKTEKKRAAQPKI